MRSVQKKNKRNFSRREVLKLSLASIATGIVTAHRVVASTPSPSSGAIQGYASATSVAPGGTISFIASNLGANASSLSFTITFSRVSAAGSGASYQFTSYMSVNWNVGNPAVPPDAYILGCNSWNSANNPAYTLTVPTTWPSGLYVAQYLQVDSNGSPTSPTNSTMIPFVVLPSNPGTKTNILVQVPFTTIQAYNTWDGGASPKGHSLYTTPSLNGLGSPEPTNQIKSYPSNSLSSYSVPVPNTYPQVSFNRPLAMSYEDADAYILWFIGWFEANGFTADYCSSIELHTGNISLSSYQLLITAGHDEYWTLAMRQNVDAYVYTGGNFAIFGGNTCWWQARLDYDSNFSTPNRTLTCYKYDASNRGKEGNSYSTFNINPFTPPYSAVSNDPYNNPSYPASIVNQTTINWYLLPELLQSNTNLTPASPTPSLYPETWTVGLSGQARMMYLTSNPMPPTPYAIYQSSHWVFNGLTVQNFTGQLSLGVPYNAATGTFGSDVMGYETDAIDFEWNSQNQPVPTGADNAPMNFQILAVSASYKDINGYWTATDSKGEQNLAGYGVMGLYQNNGTVFNAGTINWPLGLAENDTTIATITKNVIKTLSAPMTALQRATLVVYEYYAPESGGGDKFFFWPSPLVPQSSGYSYSGPAFCALVNQVTGSVPVYYYAYKEAAGGYRYNYSTSNSIGGGWVLQGIAFYAYQGVTSGSIPIYVYYAADASGDGDRFYFSTSATLGEGWTLSGIAFYVPATK